MSRVLITGGSGWLAGLLRAGWTDIDVIAVDVRPSAGVEFGDLRRSGAWTQLLSGVDTVIHLAGVGRADARRRQVWRPNVTTTTRLLDACVKHDVPRFVLASSVWALAGRQPSNGGPVPGDAPADPGRNAYGASKVAAEAALHAWSAGDSARIGVALRLGGCVANGQSPRRHQNAWEDGSWLGRTDCARAFTTARDLDQPGFHAAVVTSMCPNRLWSLDAAQSLLGFQPSETLVLLPPAASAATRPRRGSLLRRADR